MSTVGTAAPYRFFDLTVAGTEPVGQSTIRVTLTGAGVEDLVSGGRDQRLKLFVPQPGQDRPVVPTEAGTDWFSHWRAMDPGVRGVMRTYTVAAHRPARQELDIDFVRHTPAGPAAHWAVHAQPGDAVTVLGPVVDENGGFDFRPPPETDWVLIVADETALPATAGILRWLPAGTRAVVWVAVPHPADRRELPTAADAEIHWVVDGPTGVLAQLQSAELPTGTPYAWLAGETGLVRALRRQLISDRGFPKSRITFSGYWRRGASEEQLLTEALAGS
ncbi:siderophore-interacting protein [Natronosporangium hydrolyticum]|uniref:Siderophore-interacting protein n=1 Tax=Natronosporangium hydrolyticum TaxID=2811111 RepID=A0A895YC89_9ACTN|nr:siderophore-interacting protein [Natronosporangium hydrolyticum]QSB13822.1 siderophore-interacting protein [Natronosporangium hydrolyticum]